MDLAEKLSKRLEGGKFRLLNDKLYHGRGLQGRELKMYHEFYNAQIKKWPVNPLDIIIQKIKEKKTGSAVADIGCGEAQIASVFENVVSLDLYPAKEDVVFCDMAKKIPLDDESIDIAVCCLSMMVENIAVPTKEVNRILRNGGCWYVAEVRSRIDGVNFLGKKFEAFGFEVEHVDISNDHFVLFILRKRSGNLPKKLPKIRLRPCLYKKR